MRKGGSGGEDCLLREAVHNQKMKIGTNNGQKKLPRCGSLQKVECVTLFKPRFKY